MEQQLSKDVYHGVRKSIKRELFGKGKPRPFIVPKITKCEETLGKLITKTYGRQVWEIAHVKSEDKWFRALRMRKKVFILLEGRKEDRWWTITFSHGFDKNAKIHILREVMRQNQTFAPAFKRRIIPKDIDVLTIVGQAWKQKCEGKIHKGTFAKHLDKILRARKKRMVAAAERFQQKPQAVRKQYEK